uniref:Uncharacterized protein n=1 Tax=Candidatus Kentrum sp. FW TaxID=2126338 RepID=A0A450TRL5_9GAMM|nr:MAG: hypothetical protein BECKFW1821C_GA0114237_102523 [Candidatus Kentron sp. FW]
MVGSGGNFLEPERVPEPTPCQFWREALTY